MVNLNRPFLLCKIVINARIMEKKRKRNFKIGGIHESAKELPKMIKIKQLTCRRLLNLRKNKNCRINIKEFTVIHRRWNDKWLKKQTTKNQRASKATLNITDR